MPVGFEAYGTSNFIQISQDYYNFVLRASASTTTDTNGPNLFDPGTNRSQTHGSSYKNITITGLGNGPFVVALQKFNGRSTIPVMTSNSSAVSFTVYSDNTAGASTSGFTYYVYGPPASTPQSGTGLQVLRADGTVAYDSSVKTLTITATASFNPVLGAIGGFSGLDPSRSYAVIAGTPVMQWFGYAGSNSSPGTVLLCGGGIYTPSNSNTATITTMAFDGKSYGGSTDQASNYSASGIYYAVDVT